MQVALLYTLFAAIATLANIGAQNLTTRLYKARITSCSRCTSARASASS